MALARAILGWPSASAVRMLRETSINTGTTVSRADEGGSSATGRIRTMRSAASAAVRKTTSVVRCARDERHERPAIGDEHARRRPRSAIAGASHHGGSDAKCHRAFLAAMALK